MVRLSEDFIGVSLSHGTTRIQDLLPTFMDFLYEQNPYAWSVLNWELIDLGIGERVAIEKSTVGGEKYTEYVNAYECDDHPFWASEMARMMLDEDIWEALDSIAPDGTYFGAHPGDGSDYGFWQYEKE